MVDWRFGACWVASASWARLGQETPLRYSQQGGRPHQVGTVRKEATGLSSQLKRPYLGYVPVGSYECLREVLGLAEKKAELLCVLPKPSAIGTRRRPLGSSKPTFYLTRILLFIYFEPFFSLPLFFAFFTLLSFLDF